MSSIILFNKIVISLIIVSKINLIQFKYPNSEFNNPNTSNMYGVHDKTEILFFPQ